MIVYRALGGAGKAGTPGTEERECKVTKEPHLAQASSPEEATDICLGSTGGLGLVTPVAKESHNWRTGSKEAASSGGAGGRSTTGGAWELPSDWFIEGTGRPVRWKSSEAAQRRSRAGKVRRPVLGTSDGNTQRKDKLDPKRR